MIDIKIDNLMAFYIILAIIFLGGVQLVIFGKTEGNEPASKRMPKTTTTS